ncbi:hypothetical protein COHA_009030 [Chlorella ohadii]|uniref:AAA+ ATPase domain-containing protein n=1 Tax=Chlorella ohadii TaxID=2649997 RepID=A0AAD5GYG8_9CHLO|nr:hypothetical protein COHA_009030 [Chlorella ohadii]
MLGQAALAAAARWAGRTAAAGQGAPTVLRAGQQQSLAFSKAEARRMAEKNGNGGGGGGEGGGWFTDFARSKLRLFVAAGLGLVALNAGSTAAFGWWYRKSVLDTLMHGVLPPPVPPPELERPHLRQRVREILQPQEASRFYHIVTGPPGGGKSTLLREACREMGSGVGYIEVSPAFVMDWGRDLGDAFNFRFQEHVTRLNMVFKPVLGTQYEDPRSQHPLASVRQSAEALHGAAKEFRRKTGRPFVLVIDSADRLSRSEESQKVLGAMLEYARDWAQCAGLVGGSLLLMQRSAAMLKAGVPFPEVKQQLFDLIEIAYLRAGVLDVSPHQEGGLAAIEALLASKNGSISAAEWRGCVPDRERQRELLSKGVLRFDGHSVRFASNLAASYAAEQLRAKLAKSVADVHKGLRRPGWW